MSDDDNDDDTLASIMKKRRAESRLMHWSVQPCDGGWRLVRGDFELCGPSKRPLRFRTHAGAANRAMKLNREQKKKVTT